MRFRGARRTAVAILVLVAAGGIGLLARHSTGAPPAPGEVGGGGQPSLVRVDWQLVEFSVSGVTTTVPPGSDYVLRFDGRGGYRADAGCNALTGAATISGGHLTIERTITTDVACHGLDARVQSAIISIARDELGWRAHGGQLVLGDAEGNTLTYRARGSTRTASAAASPT